jgi:hypothetical protein
MNRGYLIKQIERISKLNIEDIAYIFKNIDSAYPFSASCDIKELKKVYNDIKSNGYVAIPF